MVWQIKKRIVLVGDAGCGKTALVAKLSQDLFLDYYSPTEFVEDFSAEIHSSNGTSCKLTVLDTSGSQEESNIRALAYKGCDAVIVCFDLTDESTLESVEAKWIPEVNKYCPGVPVYLAGCKRDLMCCSIRGCVCGGNCCTLSEGELMEIIGRIGAVAYVECSALTSEGVEDVFQIAVDAATTKRKKGAKKIISSLKRKSKLLRRLSAALI